MTHSIDEAAAVAKLRGTLDNEIHLGMSYADKYTALRKAIVKARRQLRDPNYYRHIRIDDALETLTEALLNDDGDGDGDSDD